MIISQQKQHSVTSRGFYENFMHSFDKLPLTTEKSCSIFYGFQHIYFKEKKTRLFGLTMFLTLGELKVCWKSARKLNNIFLSLFYRMHGNCYCRKVKQSDTSVLWRHIYQSTAEKEIRVFKYSTDVQVNPQMPIVKWTINRKW